MSEPSDFNRLCRFCHSEENSFSNVGLYSSHDDKQNLFKAMLRYTFNITMSSPELAFSVCQDCEARLHDATSFKHRVLACEAEFKQLLVKRHVSQGERTIIIDKTVNLQEESDVKSEPHDDLLPRYQDSELEDTGDAWQDDDNDDLKPDTDDTTQLDDSGHDRQNYNNDAMITHSKDEKPRQFTRKYSCNVCNKKFMHLGYLETHRKIHGEQQRYTYTCQLCNTYYRTLKAFHKHLQELHSGIAHDSSAEKYKCSVCSKEFKRKNGLKNHMHIHADEKKFQCNICNKRFGLRTTLKAHMLTHTGEKPFVCDICGRRFTQSTHMKRHITIIHKRLKQYTCKTCNKQFSTKCSLVLHERLHTGEKPFSCNVCKRNFIGYTSLKVHMRVHTGEKPYTCSFCNTNFRQYSCFKLHQLRHTGVRAYTCQICDKSFVDNGHLKIHMRIHTGERPYSCEVCKRCFREKDHMKKHMRTHTGAKSTCQVCNKQVCDLSKHMMRVHSDERPFKCGVCLKRFCLKRNLMLHMNLHLGEKAYRCKACNRRFSQMSGLERHKCALGDKVDDD